MPFHRYRYWVLAALFTLSLLTKLGLSHTTPYLNDWDERFHGLVAKNIAADNSFAAPRLYRHPVLDVPAADWARAHHWMHKPPLTTWLMAGSIKLFGVSAFAVQDLTFAALACWVIVPLLFFSAVTTKM